MDRKKFFKKSVLGLGTLMGIPSLMQACNSEEKGNTDPDECQLSPRETAGPFPNKTPAQLVKENIISDRKGVPLLMTFTIQDQSNDCNPIEGALVDVWHCDAQGAYSQYGGIRMQEADHTGKNFLRGRQTTDANGQVSFISIFPGWYPGRAPHIHLEVLDANGKSIRITQVAFPEEVCNEVYAFRDYNGKADTSNARDSLFRNSLEGNMLDSLEGSVEDGYTLKKVIIV